MSRFCIYCGVEDTPDNPVVENVCLRCRIKRGELIIAEKKEFRIDMCKICYSIKLSYKWVETNGFEDALDIFVNEHLPKYVKPGPGVKELAIDHYELVTSPSWRTVVRVYFKGLYGSKEFIYSVDFTIYFNPTKCSRCIMIDSREYEALVQIRGFNKNVIEKTLNKIARSDPRFIENLIDYIEGKNGVDLYFYDKGTARKLARMIHRLLSSSYKVVLKESFEEVGTRSGAKRTRLTISIKPV